jgi:hypothetical protein
MRGWGGERGGGENRGKALILSGKNICGNPDWAGGAGNIQPGPTGVDYKMRRSAGLWNRLMSLPKYK